ncbi:MAG: right-handed parallel beta-helix repeat-containing protein [Methanospirillaceae archaeon]|nr:right-handed parallel beta-helix repeat-containing protein [Methanospirillaceae archaeon]
MKNELSYKNMHLYRACTVLFFLFFLISVAAAQTIVPPVVITSPGSYEITDDVQSLKDQTAITIEASDVVINGNGHFIGGINRDKSIGILVNKRGENLTNVTISRVKLHDWDTGLAYRYVKGREGDTNTITKNIILTCETGIELESVDFITLSGNELSGCDTGIQAGSVSGHLTLEKNVVDRCGYGINILTSDELTLVQNQATNNEIYGISVSDGTGITLLRNSASDNQYAGIRLANVNDFSITSNDVSGSIKSGGIELGTGVSDGFVYDNYLRNKQNVKVATVAGDIAWNTTKQPGTNIVGGPYLAGNFWGAQEDEEGFSQYTPDTDGYGICDEPYHIDDIHTDYLPLHYTDKRIAPETEAESPGETGTAETEYTDNQTVVMNNADTAGEILSENEKTKDSTEGETETESSPTVATPELITYGKYSIHGPEDAAVFFVTDNKVKVFIGRITNGTLDFTVPANDIRFISYVIERDDIDTITGEITEFPGDNETVIIETSPDETKTEGTEEEVINTSVMLPQNTVPAESEENDYHEIVVSSSYGDGTITPKPTSSPSDSPPDFPPSYTIGYYCVHGPEDAAVFFVTNDGLKVFMGRITNSTLDFPVPVHGISYNSYCIEGDEIETITGEITEFPDTDETVIIDAYNSLSPKRADSVSTTDAGIKEEENTVTGKNTGDSFTVFVPETNGGTIVPDGEVMVKKGEDIIFIITPDEGYTMTSLIFDDVTLGAQKTFALQDISADHTLSATFSSL